MENLINLINKKITNITNTITFKNKNLSTIVYNTSNLFIDDLKNFANAFNSLFKGDCKNNILKTYIIHDDIIFEESKKILCSNTLIETDGIIDFNNATINTSQAKCSTDYNYYIMRCYEYFIYIFDKKNKKCFMK